MFLDKANNSRKKVAASNISLDYVFGADQFFDIILSFLLEDKLFAVIEEAVGITEFRSYMKSGNSFGVGWVCWVREINILDQMIDGNLGEKWFDAAFLIKITSY